MNRTILIFSLALLLCNHINAQNNASIDTEVDKIFETLSDTSKPGVAAVLIRDGKIVYLKGFGYANKESNTPITVQTTFQLGELSKQFTTIAILLLEEQGKISFSDDIRKYLTELPEYKHKVTIGHLINHSSGLHDVNRINYMINGSMNISSQAKVIKLIAAQKNLAFKPGTDFSFHEAITESVLMAEIVSRVSDQSFADFIKTEIFQVLGMRHSFIRDNSNTILHNVAKPYEFVEASSTYIKNEVQSSVIGAINAYCSAEDLAKWYINSTNPKGNIGRLIQKLDTPVQLTDGSEFEYYWGKWSLDENLLIQKEVFQYFGILVYKEHTVLMYLDILIKI